MSTNTKYVVVGFPKCGQLSLVSYLTAKGFDVVRNDCIWRSDAKKLIEVQNPGRQPIIIIRDQIQMIWSSYWYWHYKDVMSFPNYLVHKTRRETALGNENPLDHADYEKHIQKFADMDPLLFDFGEMIQFPDFPHENKTTGKPQIVEKFRAMIEKAIEDYKVQTPNPT